jgi:hypothetical protein
MTALVVNPEQRFKAYEENITWFRRHYAQLRKEHPDQFVAVNKGKVESDKTLEGLLARLRKKYDNDTITTFAIEFVNTNEAELAMLF